MVLKTIYRYIRIKLFNEVIYTKKKRIIDGFT